MSDVMIQVENLTKDYGPAPAVDKVTFTSAGARCSASWAERRPQVDDDEDG